VIARKDPMIGRALELLVPELDVDPSELLLAAHAGAASLRTVRRRRQTVAVVAFAALLLFAGAAVAAQRFDLLSFLHTNDRNGADPAEVARARDDLNKVGDDFIHALAVLSHIQSVGGGGGSTGPAGTERVPPRGVPAWAACRELTLTTFRCGPLAALVGVPSGTPLYFLQPSRDWRRVKAPRQDRSDFGLVLEQLLGRKVTPDETRFFVDLATVTSTSGSSSGPTKTQGTPIGVPSARGAALLAPQSLGIRTRFVSATARPLPHGRLPGGLTRPRAVRLYRVVFDTLRAAGIGAAGRHTIHVYVTRRGKLGVWVVAWVATKP
jgi:hypothetical protein